MGSPDWSKIPFDKMPEWKKEEMLGKAKQTVEQIEQSSFVCDVCGKICKNQLGLNAHKRSHNN
jgi:hypothetical protein